MENQAQIQPNIIIVTKQKSAGVAFLLTFFFGPIGLLYSSIMGGIIMLIISIVVGIVSFGLLLFIPWIISIIWALIAVNNANQKGIKDAKNLLPNTNIQNVSSQGNSNEDSITPESSQGRPSFLSVLCILTWVCSGLLFIGTMKNILFPPSPEDKMEQLEKMRKYKPEMADKMEAAFEAMENAPGEIIMSNVLNLICQILSVSGAVMMWQLNKKGFYVYLSGELLSYLGMLIPTSRVMMGIGFGAIGLTGMTIILLVFDAIFITMYAVNLKQMKS